VSQYTGVTERKNISENLAPDTRTDSRANSLIGYKRVQPGDLVVNIMLAWNGSMGISQFNGIASPAYCVYRFRGNFQPWYFHYLLRSPIYKSNIKGFSTGVVESRLRLYTDDLYRMEALVPPLDEQNAIVKYLDYMDRLIKRYIRAKQKEIKLLNEQKQAIIQQAVTRGLNPNVNLKPSGVEWLGDIPEHWEVVLNQRIFKESIRPHLGQKETQLSLSQKDGLIATSEMEERSLQTSSFENWKVTLPGDLVLNRFKAHLGVFFSATLRGIVSFHYGVFSPRKNLVTKYYELLFHTLPYKTIYAGRSNGMTVGLQNLSNQNFYNVKSLVPPFQEQLQIVNFVEINLDKINASTKLMKREISLVEDLRICLIADVVTGKLDVREAAAQLPEELTAFEPEEELPEEEALEEEEAEPEEGEA
jgi:type I restriction enzyme, S subunit